MVAPEYMSIVPLLLFLLAICLVVIYTAIFAFHWNAYGSSKKANTTALFLYAGGSVICLLTMAISPQLT